MNSHLALFSASEVSQVVVPQIFMEEARRMRMPEIRLDSYSKSTYAATLRHEFLEVRSISCPVLRRLIKISVNKCFRHCHLPPFLCRWDCLPLWDFCGRRLLENLSIYRVTAPFRAAGVICKTIIKFVIAFEVSNTASPHENNTLYL